MAHKINAVSPRLSDEDIDPIEQDDPEHQNTFPIDDWMPWNTEDIEDIRKIINDKMPSKSKFVLESFLNGLTFFDVGVTEKYWRYHFNKGVEYIKLELKL